MEVGRQIGTQFVLALDDTSHIGEARRAIVRCAENLNMSETDCGAVAIAVTEMATNVLKHAGRGRMLCGRFAQNGTSGLRLITLDNGPGIRDMVAALRDGYSTTGTPGNGMGAVKRLATQFDVYSLPDKGTCVLAEFLAKKDPSGTSPLQLGVVSVPAPNESVCGDGWQCKGEADRTYLMVVDGLGHGEYAAEAAREAEQVLAAAQDGSPSAILRDCHDALKKTRGAAIAIAVIHHTKGTLAFCGLGNVSATLISADRSRGLASHNGTVGHNLHRTQEFTFPWNENDLLIMHSDGLGSRWDLERYPGLSKKHPSLVAAVLYRDFSRQRDDVTVLVAKNS